MAASFSDASDIEKLGWRQGAVVPDQIVAKLIEDGQAQNSEESRWVVISHSCDVVNSDYTKEPNVEVIAGSWAEERGDCFKGKNPRVYQLFFDGRCLELAIERRISFPRHYLTLGGPLAFIEEDELKRLRRWLALRYSRAAFPDEFNRRTRRLSDIFRSELKKSNLTGSDRARMRALLKHVTEIFVYTDDAELPKEQDYRLSMFLLMDPNDHADKHKRDEAQEIADFLEAELQQCKGINVLDVVVSSEEEFSYHASLVLRRWDYDFLSEPEEIDRRPALPQVRPT